MSSGDRPILALALMMLLAAATLGAQTGEWTGKMIVTNSKQEFEPFEEVTVVLPATGTVVVKDGSNREYVRIQAGSSLTFMASGSAGSHHLTLYDKKGKAIDSAVFVLRPKTRISDGGLASEMFRLFYTGMLVYNPEGVEEIAFGGNTYRYFVNWVLDNNNVMRGMQYFNPESRGMVDLFKLTQQPNGMIWSFVRSSDDDHHYYETAYSPIHFFRHYGDVWFVRQPVENHVEYNFVNMIYQHWKASGDNAWMKSNLDCASRALDYCVTDSVRWSKRFQLLRRPYCIDSWDFQVNDEYTPYAPISPTMVIVPGKTKYGVFFGDNTGYMEACNQLAEMFLAAGESARADAYKHRAGDIFTRLNNLAWNGNFYRHFIDDDPSVKRNLGVDETIQIAQGNMYSINRGLPYEMNVAIIKSYLKLRENIPPGSPGEWYSIYPPFERGFGQHNQKWQYMNGGVAGHAAGELARGAFENGYEEYAAGILSRLNELGQNNGNRVWFAYTGSIPPPPPPPAYNQVDISRLANMDLWDKGEKDVFVWMNAGREGNDMRGLPVGLREFSGIPFEVIDPERNSRRAAIGLSTLNGFPGKVEIQVDRKAACVYLLHSSSDNIPSNVAGAITFQYSDGTTASQYLMKGRHVTNWWFSALKNDYAGVAWKGPNPVSAGVGVCWAATDNPHPDKAIRSLVFHAPLEGGIYALLGITLADRQHYVKPPVESYGGPDNWAAANAMAAFVEGLAGVKNEGLAFDRVRLSPRWIYSGIDSVEATVHFPASDGYISYKYVHRQESKKMKILIAGSGKECQLHLPLPKGSLGVSTVTENGRSLAFSESLVGESKYVDFDMSLKGVIEIVMTYR